MGGGAVHTEGAQREVLRIRWRAAMLAAGRAEDLRALARGVKWQEKLTYNPAIVP